MENRPIHSDHPVRASGEQYASRDDLSSRTWATSRYSFAIPLVDKDEVSVSIEDLVDRPGIREGKFLLYSTRTGAVVHLEGQSSLTLASTLTHSKELIDGKDFSYSLLSDLVKGGFLIPPSFDERREVQNRFWFARETTPMVVTITTTMDCNLGCYYCYEERSAEALSGLDIESIVSATRQRLVDSGKKSLHVDWYGGEPLLNLDFLAPASFALQNLCIQLGVSYNSSVISNGTCWPNDVGAFIREHRIRQVQLSFDGLKHNHDKRRRYRSGSKEESSFEVLCVLIEELLDHVRVDLRLNVDRGNESDIEGLVEMIQNRGWHERRYAAVVQPARLASFSDHSSFMRKSELTVDEFETVRKRVRIAVDGSMAVEESETPDGVLRPRASVCAALADDSFVIGADLHVYRCGLQVGEVHRAVGRVGDGSGLEARDAGIDFADESSLVEVTLAYPLPVLDSLSVTESSGSDRAWWKEFDPTTLASCSSCSFLPICWGGCPKKHLEGDAHALEEQSQHWRQNLARLVAEGVGMQALNSFTLSEEDQFRDGYV